MYFNVQLDKNLGYVKRDNTIISWLYFELTSLSYLLRTYMLYTFDVGTLHEKA
jgi:hypothetical protein